MLRWLEIAAKRPGGKLNLLLPTQPLTRRRRTGGQMEMWVTMFKADLELLFRLRVFGYIGWGKNWAKASCELAQDRLVRNAFMRDVVSRFNPPWMNALYLA